MTKMHTLLGCILIASLSFLPVSTSWSAPQAKKQVKKTAVHKAKKRAKATVPTLRSGKVAPVVASATGLALVTSAAAVASQEPMLAPSTPTPGQVASAAPLGQGPVAPVPPAATAPATPAVAMPAPSQPGANPYLAYQQAVAPMNPLKSLGELFDDIKMGLPHLPLEGQAILPVIKKVYPTGEKPLVVITFKCPTEVIGITPLPTKALHELVNFGFDGINKTNLLSFNLQQVCQ